MSPTPSNPPGLLALLPRLRRRDGRGSGRGRARFLGIAVVAAATALLLLDWLLFGAVDLGDHLRVDDLTSARGKLLMASRHRDSLVLFLGDSRVLTGVDPSAVSEMCQCGSGFNAAFALADPVLTRVFARRLLDVLSPRVIVIGVSEWWLSDAADIQAFWPARELLPPWEVAKLARFDDTGEVLSSAIASAWRVYRYRAEIRSTLGLGPSSQRLDHRRGYLPHGWRSQAPRERDALILKEAGFRNFSVDGRRRAAMRELLDELRGRPIAVMLMAPPVHPVILRLLRGELEEFRRALARLAAEGHARLEDLATPDWITAADFSDIVHLNEAGAEKLSRYLGLRLRSAPPAAHALQ